MSLKEAAAVSQGVERWQEEEAADKVTHRPGERTLEAEITVNPKRRKETEVDFRQRRK